MTTPFGNAIALQKWLHGELEVPEDAAAAASPWLWKEGWFRESKAFIGADAQQLSGLAPGLANSIYQRLLPWQQQQAREQLDEPKNKKACLPLLVRFVKGVNPSADSTLTRERLVSRVLERSSKAEFILLKGPAAIGKTSVMILAAHFCQTNTHWKEGENLSYPTPATGFTWMERDKPPKEQLRDALTKMEEWKQGEPERILFCDDVQNVDSGFWEQLVSESRFLEINHVRIVGATTRRCASDPASPILESSSVISFPELCLDEEETTALFGKFMSYKTFLSSLADEALSMVLDAVTEQCGGHVFAIIASLDQLDNFASIQGNFTAELIISHLLSQAFLNESYTRIWPKNTDNFSAEDRSSLKNAIMDDKNKVSVELQVLLMKIYFLQDTGQHLEERSWSEMKQEMTFNLASRRLYCFLFPTRGAEDYKANSLVGLVIDTLRLFSSELLQQAGKASETKRFPKEGALQQMFFSAITSILPPTTEVVSEMSAVLPDRGDKKRGELDFYVNSGYYYGIELMRDGGSFQEHKERFLKPCSGNPNKGKYFTPMIKEYVIVDFRGETFKSKTQDKFRLIVRFAANYSSCHLSLGKKDLGKIVFK